MAISLIPESGVNPTLSALQARRSPIVDTSTNDSLWSTENLCNRYTWNTGLSNWTHWYVTTANCTTNATTLIYPGDIVYYEPNEWVPLPLPETDEQRLAREIEQRRYQAEHEARRAVRQSAEDKARALFLALLTPEQRAMHEREGAILVRAAATRRRYRVHTAEMNGRHGNIVELAPDSDDVIASLCCAPGGDIPHFDAILGQLLALQHDEDAFRQRANFTPRRRVA